MQPLDLFELTFFWYVTPGIPDLIENPFVLIEPDFVLRLGVIPDLLILMPKPLPKLILFWNLKDIITFF